MLKIGEFSQINRVTVKALRLYDRLGLLKPKTVDRFSQYRFYTTDQIPLAQEIISLKQIGFSLSEVAEIIKNDSSFLDKLQYKEKEIQKQIGKSNDQLRNIRSYIDILRKESKMEYHIILKELPEVIVASMRKVIKNYEELNTIYPTMGELMQKQKLECSKPAYCFTEYHEKEYKDHDVDVEICEAVVKAGKEDDGMTFKTVSKVPQAACTFHKGPYTTISKAYGALAEWIEKNGYKVDGNYREAGIDGIWNKDNPNDWLTELQVPVIKK